MQYSCLSWLLYFACWSGIEFMANHCILEVLAKMQKKTHRKAKKKSVKVKTLNCSGLCKGNIYYTILENVSNLQEAI